MIVVKVVFTTTATAITNVFFLNQFSGWIGQFKENNFVAILLAKIKIQKLLVTAHVYRL